MALTRIHHDVTDSQTAKNVERSRRGTGGQAYPRADAEQATYAKDQADPSAVTSRDRELATARTKVALHWAQKNPPSL